MAWRRLLDSCCWNCQKNVLRSSLDASKYIWPLKKICLFQNQRGQYYGSEIDHVLKSENDFVRNDNLWINDNFTLLISLSFFYCVTMRLKFYNLIYTCYSRCLVFAVSLHNTRFSWLRTVLSATIKSNAKKSRPINHILTVKKWGNIKCWKEVRKLTAIVSLQPWIKSDITQNALLPDCDMSKV